MHCPAKKIFLSINIFLGWIVWQNIQPYLHPRINATSLHDFLPASWSNRADFSYPLISNLVHWFPPPPQISNVSILELLRGWRRCWGIRSIRRTFSSNLLAHRVTPVCSIHRRQPWEIRCTNIWEKPEFIILLLFFFFFWEERRMCKWSKNNY